MAGQQVSHVRPDRRSLSLGGIGVLGLIAFSGLAAQAGLWKVLAISWAGFAALAGGALLGTLARRTTARRLVWGYGIASGAMITSAAIFLLPQALGPHSAFGGFGVALGFLAGYAGHTLGHRLTHVDATLDTAPAELTAHSLAAGVVIGLVYATLPELGLLLGFAIISHKAPAGYAAARRLGRIGRSTVVLLLPAAGVGLTALPAALIDPVATPAATAGVFGFAAGVFLHVAADFLPECEVGGEVSDVADLAEDAHDHLDRLRVHAIASTTLGGVGVFVGWLVVP